MQPANNLAPLGQQSSRLLGSRLPRSVKCENLNSYDHICGESSNVTATPSPDRSEGQNSGSSRRVTSTSSESAGNSDKSEFQTVKRKPLEVSRNGDDNSSAASEIDGKQVVSEELRAENKNMFKTSPNLFIEGGADGELRCRSRETSDASAPKMQLAYDPTVMTYWSPKAMHVKFKSKLSWNQLGVQLLKLHLDYVSSSRNSNITSTPAVIGHNNPGNRISHRFLEANTAHLLELLFREHYLEWPIAHLGQNQKFPSIGAILHDFGVQFCKPCVFANKSSKSCRNRERCLFCHHTHKERRRKRDLTGQNDMISPLMLMMMRFHDSAPASKERASSQKCQSPNNMVLSRGDKHVENQAFQCMEGLKPQRSIFGDSVRNCESRQRIHEGSSDFRRGSPRRPGDKPDWIHTSHHKDSTSRSTSFVPGLRRTQEANRPSFRTLVPHLPLRNSVQNTVSGGSKPVSQILSFPSKNERVNCSTDADFITTSRTRASLSDETPRDPSWCSKDRWSPRKATSQIPAPSRGSVKLPRPPQNSELNTDRHEYTFDVLKTRQESCRDWEQRSFIPSSHLRKIVEEDTEVDCAVFGLKKADREHAQEQHSVSPRPRGFFNLERYCALATETARGVLAKKENMSLRDSPEYMEAKLPHLPTTNLSNNKLVESVLGQLITVSSTSSPIPEWSKNDLLSLADVKNFSRDCKDWAEFPRTSSFHLNKPSTSGRLGKVPSRYNQPKVSMNHNAHAFLPVSHYSDTGKSEHVWQTAGRTDRRM